MNGLQYSPLYQAVRHSYIQILRKQASNFLIQDLDKCVDDLVRFYFDAQLTVLHELLQKTDLPIIRIKWLEVRNICLSIKEKYDRENDFSEVVSLDKLLLHQAEFTMKHIPEPQKHDKNACEALGSYMLKEKSSSSMKKIAGEFGTTTDAMKEHWKCHETKIN